MKKTLDIIILIAFVCSGMPAHTLVIPALDVAAAGSWSLPPVRELSAQELAAVRGGFRPPPTGGGGGKGGPTQPIKVERHVSPKVPNVYQRMEREWRSDHYCGFAVALMLQYWVNNDKPGRIWQEYDLRDLDLKAQNGDFGWPIDVLFNGGFLCTNIGVDNEENWARSKVAASNLFCIHDRLDKLILTTQPVDQEPEVGLSTAWQRIHGYDDSNKNKRLPTIIVTKTGETTLHYMLIVGTEKEGSEEGFWVNDPWLDVENPSYIPRWKLDEDMSIPFGQYGWVGYVMNGKGIFGFLTEHNYWR